MRTVEIKLNEKNKVSLTGYLQDISTEYAGITKRPAVIVLPGGGYSVCSDREADIVALSYLNAGFHAFILRYTLKTVEAWPAPLADYEEAMELLYSHREDWHIDMERIAVCGFSAGGHLAACAATVSKYKPAAAILGYAALKKDIVEICQKGATVPLENVNRDTCPCFLFATRTDSIVDISKTLEFEQKLTENGVAFESHIYSCGAHGFSTGCEYMNGAELTTRAAHWVTESVGWLEELWGKLQSNGYSEPLFERRMNENDAERLSVRCTYNYVYQFEDAKKILSGLESRLQIFSSDVRKIVETFKIEEIMDAVGIAKEQKTELDKQLKKIKNKKRESNV